VDQWHIVCEETDWEVGVGINLSIETVAYGPVRSYIDAGLSVTTN
jgi:hypothetical protein